MNDKTLHTFAVIAYQQSPYLAECLSSVMNQTQTSKVIICTSTPSDYLTAMAKKFGVELRVNNSRRGIGADWDFALNQATTKYVTLAHQDDLYYPHYAEECVRAAQNSQQNLITFTDYEEIISAQIRKTNLNLKIKRCLLGFWFMFSPQLRSHLARKLLLALGSPICCPSVMYHREELQSFTFSAELRINLDWDAWIKLAAYPGSFTFVNKILSAHRIHSESETSHGIENNLRAKEDILLFSKIYPAPLVRFLAKLYSRSYNTNKTSPK